MVKNATPQTVAVAAQAVFLPFQILAEIGALRPVRPRSNVLDAVAPQHRLQYIIEQGAIGGYV